jgi:hypothetical protein
VENETGGCQRSILSEKFDKDEKTEGELEKYLYSSLIPYPNTKSDNSFKTAAAAAFIRSNALASFGFAKSYLDENLSLKFRPVILLNKMERISRGRD